MKIYELDFDTFKNSYTGYWTSLEKAKQELLNCARFNKALSWNMPHFRQDGDVNLSPDWDYNKKLKPIFVLKDDSALEIWFEGVKFDASRLEIQPEIKEEGQPYTPEKQTRIQLGSTYETHFAGRIYYREIELDLVEK